MKGKIRPLVACLIAGVCVLGVLYLLGKRCGEFCPGLDRVSIISSAKACGGDPDPPDPPPPDPPCENPFFATINIHYKKPGMPGYRIYKLKANMLFDPAHSCYDGCKTSENRGFIHLHPVLDFPVWNEDYQEYVYLGDVAACWRWLYEDKGDYIEEGVPSVCENCFGSLTAYRCWINGDQWGVILADDFESASEIYQGASIYVVETAHAVGIFDYSGKWIVVTGEKNQESQYFFRFYDVEEKTNKDSGTTKYYRHKLE